MSDTPATSNGIPSALNQGKSLTERTLSGMFWNMAGAGVQAVLHIAVLAVLARLLTPQDFGVVGAAAVVIGFSQIFTQLGVGPAIVQRADLQDEHVRAGFTFSLLLGVVCGSVLFLVAPLIAGFFRMEGLAPVMRVLALAYPLGGPTVVAEALLLRSMQFRKIAGIEVLSYALGYGLIGITLAVLGLGVWALVAASLSQIATKAVSFSLAGSLRVRFSLDTKPLCQLLNFGVGFSLAKIANHIAGQGDSLVVGRWLGAEALGIYGRAHQFMVMPANLFGTVVDRVLFPAMAAVQNDRERLAEAYSRAVSLIAMIALPTSAVLFALAPEIVYVMLGPQWDAVVPPFRILALVLVFRTSYRMSDSLARATGAVYRRAWRQWVYAGAIFGGAWLGQFVGTQGVAVGVAAAVILNFVLMLELSASLVPVQLMSLLRIHMRHLIVAAAVGLVAWLAACVVRWYHLPAPLVLGIACLAGGSGLFIASRFRGSPLGNEGTWAWSLLKSRVRSIRATSLP